MGRLAYFLGGLKVEDGAREVGKAMDWLSLIGKGPKQRERVVEDVYQWLVQPVHASTLSLFRFAYGMVMVMQIMKWWYIFDGFQGSIYMLPYAGVGFVKPVDPGLGNLIVTICLLSSLLLALGLFTRLSGVVTFLTFAYLFHMCESLHNNHYILMCHVNFVGMFLNWGEWCSLDCLRNKGKRRNPTLAIPYWNLLLMQLLFCIPYLFGSIAKMNSDWLFRAQPVTAWFEGRPGWFYNQWWFPWLICWSGMGYDAVVSFLLIWKKTRFILGFPAAFFFNVSNKLMFNIGVFPLAMICSLMLFLDPHVPAGIWCVLNGANPPVIPQAAGGKSKDDFDVGSARSRKVPQNKGWYKKFVLLFVGSFVAFHSLFPLRHFVLYKSNPSWTEEGHIGAWHMKLRSKHGWLVLLAEEMDGNTTVLMPNLDPLVIGRQLTKLRTRPHATVLYISRLQMVFEEAQRPLKSLRVQSCFSLNENPEKQLFIPTANMLDFVGKYERIGTTAVDKFLYAQEDAPECKSVEVESGEQTSQQAIREAYRQLYEDANFRVEIAPARSGMRKTVFHQSPGSTKKEYGYTWKKWGY